MGIKRKRKAKILKRNVINFETEANFGLKLRPKDEIWSLILRPHVSGGFKWRRNFGPVSKFIDYFEAQSPLETKNTIGLKNIETARFSWSQSETNLWVSLKILRLKIHSVSKGSRCLSPNPFGLQIWSLIIFRDRKKFQSLNFGLNLHGIL